MKNTLIRHTEMDQLSKTRETLQAKNTDKKLSQTCDSKIEEIKSVEKKP